MKNKVELKNGVTLEVGKKYIHPTWLKDEVYEVTAIGETIFVYKPKDCDYELTHEIDNNWLPYEEEKTENYCKILIERTDGALTSFEECFIKEKELIHLEDRVFNYVSYDVLKEYSSKEEMIKDLKK